MSYRVLLKSIVKAETIDSLFLFLEKNLPNVRSFKGCLNVTVLYDDASNKIVFDELWTSRENHQAYIAFIESNGVLGSLAEFLEGPPNICYYKIMDL
jgi:quinol monooxygenase YgiN